jgi:hypothetical protein
MPARLEAARLRQKEVAMDTFWTIVVMGIVLVIVPGFAIYAVVEMSPFGRHKDHYRDPVTGARRWEAPNLEDGH